MPTLCFSLPFLPSLSVSVSLSYFLFLDCSVGWFWLYWVEQFIDLNDVGMCLKTLELTFVIIIIIIAIEFWYWNSRTMSMAVVFAAS